MTNLTIEDKINIQRDKFQAPEPLIELVSPCRVNEGILSYSDAEKQKLRTFFNEEKRSLGFFIPASGSGSRMFEFLYEFLSVPSEANQALVERFINSIEEFAFYAKLPLDAKQSIEKGAFSLEELIMLILGKNGLGYGSLPKGLVPFHKRTPFILTPFQEHILQGAELKSSESKFHFTVQETFKEQITSNLKILEEFTGKFYETSFSIQDMTTNAVAFYEDGTICRDENGEMVTRPSGHGALLPNLASSEGDIVFIKNIDNVQHFDKSEKTTETWELLGGVLMQFRKECEAIHTDPDFSKFSELNKKYQLLPESQLEFYSSNEEIRALLDRPARVCGMVRNQGQPGGGPFWVNEKGRITKQIVEKAQIASSQEQSMLLVKSTHFNPVMIAACMQSFNGEKYNLKDFTDETKYFKVSKTHAGKKIGYIESPGLWNGSMAHWNTIFVEIPSEVFSPVKTILDLLDEPHKG